MSEFSAEYEVREMNRKASVANEQFELYELQYERRILFFNIDDSKAIF